MIDKENKMKWLLAFLIVWHVESVTGKLHLITTKEAQEAALNGYGLSVSYDIPASTMLENRLNYIASHGGKIFKITDCGGEGNRYYELIWESIESPGATPGPTWDNEKN
jgi:hypothetical protein